FSFPSATGNSLLRTDESFRYDHLTSGQGSKISALWRGAGLAIPVFSLRSEKGCGIGEYNDLRLLTDWAARTGMKLVQTLPVNDTIASKTWTDSYPYNAISVFALHPLYINLQSIAKLKDPAAAARLEAEIAKLNQSETVDFEGVLRVKTEFFKLLYEQEKAAFFKDKTAQKFIEENADWLKPYAVFCHLRDVNGTTDFNAWKEHASYSPKVVSTLCNPKYKAFDEVGIHLFIQYHAHLQLLGATNYARQHGVILKGDLPIGVHRESCDAWVAPHLYNMDGQAGAPPDLYAVDGQNWGFPTYNWAVMAQDGFAWWQQRMTKLAEYFDALRIDHILGFFRIWEIPTNQSEGTMGLFNPRLPYSRHDLAAMGLHGSLDRYLQPYIRAHFLGEMFGNDAGLVVENFLEQTSPGVFRLRNMVDNQLKIKQLFANDGKFAKLKHLEKPLKRLVSEVLLLEEPAGFNPRITIHATRSYQDLSAHEKGIFDRLYDDYFQVRHDEFWKKQALWKLPALLKASNMLICGEDLGMIPRSVPGVMRDLNIVSLKIQRAPSGPVEFDDPATYPWTSVCSPSCHDMSTVRGWWEGDHERSQRFLNGCLHISGPAPKECTAGVVEAVNRQHLASPSIWAIFPVQDLLGMDARLRRPDAAAEQINDPSIVPHYWRFRLHLPIEGLLNEDGLNEKLKLMVWESGR
nr:4-alpha-glucanotransferase [Saprospiraceae bacterium]